MKIKLCGMRRPQDIQFVNEFGPDYIGFVFAPSRRRVTAREARDLTDALREGIQTVGVFVNEPLESLLETARIAGLDVIQLHGDEDEDYLGRLRKRTALPVWKAVRVRQPDDLARADALPVDALLADCFSPTAYGGTGKTADWDLIAGVHTQKPLFLAGGLCADNLEEAIRRVRPDGVDLSGGIETDGCKDREKIKAVMETFRRARAE